MGGREKGKEEEVPGHQDNVERFRGNIWVPHYDGKLLARQRMVNPAGLG